MKTLPDNAFTLYQTHTVKTSRHSISRRVDPLVQKKTRPGKQESGWIPLSSPQGNRVHCVTLRKLKKPKLQPSHSASRGLVEKDWTGETGIRVRFPQNKIDHFYRVVVHTVFTSTAAKPLAITQGVPVHNKKYSMTIAQRKALFSGQTWQTPKAEFP